MIYRAQHGEHVNPLDALLATRRALCNALFDLGKYAREPLPDMAGLSRGEIAAYELGRKAR